MTHGLGAVRLVLLAVALSGFGFGQSPPALGEGPGPSGVPPQGSVPDEDAATLPSAPEDPFLSSPSNEGADANEAESTANESAPSSPAGAPPGEPCSPAPGQETKSEPVFQRYTWDPRSGYGLCDRVCAQGEACVDGRCVLRCSPDCRDGTYCTAAGECLPMPSPPVDVQTEEEQQTRFGKASADKTHAASVDLSGILFRGAKLNFEWGRRHAMIVRFVPMNTGLMNYFEEPRTEYERFEWGLAGALGYRRYEARFGNLRGFYYGGSAGYSVTEVRDDIEDFYKAYAHRVAVSGEFGYRWAFNHFLFGFGPTLGLRLPIYEARQSLGSESCIAAGDCESRGVETSFEGTLSLEVGWFP